MTDLDDRLHALRSAPVPPGPDADEVRHRARHRMARRRRRITFVGVPVILVLVVLGAALALAGDDASESVVTGPDPTTTDTTFEPTTSEPDGASTTRPTTSVGNAEGVSLRATPTTDLHDGQLVTVEIDGLARLSTPIIVLCAADLTAETAARDCDLTPLEMGGTSAGQTKPSGSQQVVVRRVLRLPREATAEDDQGGPFDCATEPVGCALVVGSSTAPVKGVGVAVSFSGDDLPVPEVSLDPATSLVDRQEVQVRATGLRPHSTFTVSQCTRAEAEACDEIELRSAKADGDGVLATNATAHAAIYGWKGRFDCTVVACVIQVRTEGGETQAEAPLAFAPGTVAPDPRLAISPAGPYDDRQTVTITGTGFPPGFDASSAIGLCPADGDSAVLNHCGYGSLRNGPVIVDEDGRFTTTIELFAQRCRTTAGCVLGWVLNHGPTIAQVPVSFR
jgi:hypothetical protein